MAQLERRNAAFAIVPSVGIISKVPPNHIKGAPFRSRWRGFAIPDCEDGDNPHQLRELIIKMLLALRSAISHKQNSERVADHLINVAKTIRQLQ